MTAPERVPGDLVHRLQDEQTPTDTCGPHCHQGAVIEALIDEIKGMRQDNRERHRVVMGELSEVKGNVGDLQAQFAQLAMLSARTATLAGETASHQAMSPQDAARLAPESEPPPHRRKLPQWVFNLLAGIGAMISGALAGWAATKR